MFPGLKPWTSRSTVDAVSVIVTGAVLVAFTDLTSRM